MGSTSRRSAIARLLSVPIIGSIAGLKSASVVKAVALPGRAEASSEHLGVGLAALRFLNTLEYWYRGDTGHFGDLPQLAVSQAKNRLASDSAALKYFKITPDLVAGMRLHEGAEIVPGWKLSLSLRNGDTGYWISLEDIVSDSGLITTDDRGVINSRDLEGHRVPAGEVSLLRRTRVMLRQVAFTQLPPGSDCCDDHMCCCQYTCEDTYRDGSKNCGCLLCTWCPSQPA